VGSNAGQIESAYGISSALARKIVTVSNRLGLADAGWLANLINFESAGTFDPSITNSLGYTGLIQFGTAAASDLGTTTGALRGMGATAQMDYVYEYLRRRLPIENTVDLYMAVFYPVSMGDPDYRFPSRVIAANNGIDTPREYARRANQNAELPTGMRGSEILDTGVRYLPWLFWGSAALLSVAMIWRVRWKK
jgi:hypothetical protein